MAYDPYVALAGAIIARAIKDYQRADKQVKRGLIELECVRDHYRHFFFTKEFEMLAGDYAPYIRDKAGVLNE